MTTKQLSTIYSAVMALAILSPNCSYASSCYKVDDWSSSDYSDQALISPVECTTIPENTGWTSACPDIWLRIPLTDPHVTGWFDNIIQYDDNINYYIAGWKFEPQLICSYESNSTQPTIQTALMTTSQPYTNHEVLKPYPPMQDSLQGLRTNQSHVRLRNIIGVNHTSYINHHDENGTCIYGDDVHAGAFATTKPCSGDEEIEKMTYVLEQVGAGSAASTKYRLRNKNNGLCLDDDGNSIYQVDCNNSPSTFLFKKLSTDNSMFHIYSSNSSRCISFDEANEELRMSPCDNTNKMSFHVDVIKRGEPFVSNIINILGGISIPNFQSYQKLSY